MCCEEAFLKRLHELGLRLTPQREIILSIMHDMEGHVTADEIYARVQSVSTAVDLATVYRTLDLLQELHLVACVDLGDGQRRYELLGVHGNHHHLLCRQCGKLLTLSDEEMQPLVYLSQVHGFVAQLDHLILPGICQECQAQESDILAAAS